MSVANLFLLSQACESDAKVDSMLDEASEGEVAFLVVGDVFGATTHSDLQLRAARRGIEVSVIHNSTVMTAVGACGLQLYRFGECVSIVFFTDTWRPDSFYDKIKANRSLGLHTLCLLDIRVKEPDMEALCRGKTGVYEPPRFMNVNTAIEELLEVEEKRGEGVYDASTMAVGLARVGCGARQQIVAGAMGELLKVRGFAAIDEDDRPSTAERPLASSCVRKHDLLADTCRLAQVDFGEPLHSLIICGHVTEFEQEMLELYGAAKRAGNE